MASVRREASLAQRRKDEQISSIRFQRKIHNITLKITLLCREELTSVQRHRSVALTRCETLEASRDEMKRRLDEFTDVLNLSPDEVHLSSQNLGSGSFAGECNK